MLTIVTIIYVFIVIALVGVVLLQRSEGGALGIGSSGGGGFMSGRGAANALTRATSILGGLFIIFCLGLSIFGEKPVTVDDIARELTGQENALPTAITDGDISSEDLLDSLGDLGISDEEQPSDLLTLPVEEEPVAEEETPEPAAEDDPQ